MGNELDKTIRLRRKARITTDELGRSVWVDTVETAQLELVSTQMLEALINEDGDRRPRLEEAMRQGDGVLAHDPDRDAFEIVSDDDLRLALEASGNKNAALPREPTTYEVEEASTTVDELSLVSTQMLRAMLDPDGTSSDEHADDKVDAGGGFNPYDNR